MVAKKINLSKGNAKLRKTARKHDVKIMGFDLPAIKTCPFRGACEKICYARKGRFVFPDKLRTMDENFEMTKSSDFVQSMVERLTFESQHTIRDRVCIRIHASGDFYSEKYARDWCAIATACPNVTFYAYTKSVRIVKSIAWPSNVHIAYSIGGKQDLEIPETGTIARIFKTREEASANGYDPAINDDDLLVCTGKRLGLVEH